MRKLRILPMFLVMVLMACGPGNPSPEESQSEGSVPPAVENSGYVEGNVASSEDTISHKFIPGELPEDTIYHAGDQDASQKAEKKLVVSGDRFTFGQFERPFNAFTMDRYFGAIDIQDFTLYQDDEFIYAAIIVKTREPGAEPEDGKYALEFDLDLDGRGDVLAVFSNPISTDWTTDGVQIWIDKNEDIGGNSILNADSAGAGDGFETQVFGQGIGDDPDLAWVRISSDDPNTLNFAIRMALFEGDTNFLVGAWAGGADLDPALFDLNDHFTHEQAGAAIAEFEFFYPIKELSAIDNTCRLPVGFTPNGGEPGMCSIPGVTPPEGGEPGNPGSCNLSCPGARLDPVKCTCNPIQ